MTYNVEKNKLVQFHSFVDLDYFMVLGLFAVPSMKFDIGLLFG